MVTIVSEGQSDPGSRGPSEISTRQDLTLDIWSCGPWKAYFSCHGDWLAAAVYALCMLMSVAYLCFSIYYRP